MKLKKVIAGVLSTCMVAAAVMTPMGTISVKAIESGEEKQVKSGNPLRLWYDKPASQGALILNGGGFGTTDEDNRWQQYTLPIGNSKMGANVYGEISAEKLTFNQKTLWNGGPSTSRPSYNGGNITTASNGIAMAEVFKKVGQLFKEGKDGEASDMCNQLVGAGSEGYGAYQSWGDINLNFKDLTGKSASNYSRDLDLTTAVSNVDFVVDGTSYHREYFISHPDNVLAMKLTATGGNKLNFNVSFPVDNADGITGRNLGKNVTYTATGNTLVTQGSMQDNQMKMNSMLKVVVPAGNGTVNPNSDSKSLDIANASEVMIYISADTDYANDYPVYRTGETDAQLAASVKQVVDQASGKGYVKVKEDHVKDYQNIFNRVSLDLRQGQTVSDKTTDTLLAAYKAGTASQGERGQMESLLYQYGRYLTIESSREGDLPSNLQGVWQNRVGDANRVPWGSDYHMNVNLQMNYWPTYSANMAECATPLIDYVDSLREPGRVTAAAYLGIESGEGEENGFTAHTQNTPFGWTCPGWDFSWGWSPAAVPWILQNCWEYYEYTGDKNYMGEKIYPMLKEEAKLYDQLLVESNDEITLADGTKAKRLVSVPTYSPEQGPRTMGNAYENELIWQLYEDAITAAEILGTDKTTDKDLVDGWKYRQERLAPVEVGDSGQIKEWYNETTLGSIGSTGHRHMSHLLGLFPGDLISVDNDEYMDAALVSLKDRGTTSTGWGMGQRINSWARTGDGDMSYQLIKNLFRDGIYPNMWDTHSPFQIDGNFGYTSGVNEMLMQSNMGYINILPALPSDWNTGSVDGIVARGNFELGIDWSNGKAKEVNILSKNGGDCTVQYLGISKAAVKDKDGKPVSYTTIGRDRIRFATTEGAEYTVTDFVDVAAGPEGLEAVYDGTSATLTWTAVSGAGVTYNVYRKETGSYEKIAEGLTKAEYKDTTKFDEPEKVKYKVTFTVNDEESDYSEMVSPTDLTVKGMVDDNDSKIVYEGGWDLYKETKHYNGTIHYINTSAKGDNISMSFYGTGIKAIVAKNKMYGIMDVLIDGEKVGQIDSYANVEGGLARQVGFEKNGLTDGKHTIELQATGEKNSASTGTKLEFDGFIVLGEERTFTFASDKEGIVGVLPENITSHDGDIIVLPNCDLIVKGFAFKGWNDGEKTYAAGSSYDVKKKDVTFNAVWEASELGFKIPFQSMTAVADSEQGSGSDGPAGWAVDGNEGTIWHTRYSGTGAVPDIPNNTNNSFTITLDQVYNINAFEYVARAQHNGRILKYKLLYSPTEIGDNFVELAEGTWANDAAKKSAKFTPVNARRIQIRAMETAGDTVNKFISASEFYVYQTGDPTGIALNKKELTLEAGNSETLTATLTPTSGVIKNVKWESSNEAAVTVDGGVVTAVAAGTATITVSSAANPAVKETCQVTVTAPASVPVTEVQISQAEAELTVGATTTLSAAVKPDNATNKQVLWSTDKPAVATVKGGVVTGVAKGTATITVSSVANPVVKATCQVTVKEGAVEVVPVASVTVTPNEVNLKTGQTQKLSAAVAPVNATNKNITWKSLQENIATVDEDGVVTAVAPGDAALQAVSDENAAIFGTATVHVTSANVAVESITLSKKSVQLEEDATETLTYVLAPQNATNKNVKWETSNSSVATIDGGVVTAVAEGTANITISSVENSQIKDTCVVTVTKKPVPDVPVTGVTISKGDLTLTEGDTHTLGATVKPENATNKNVFWSSSDNKTVEVDTMTGKVTAVKAGSAEIRVTTESGSFFAICNVTVNAKEVPVTGIVITPSNIVLKEGAKATFAATVIPVNATNKNVTWTSDNKAVATVTSNEKNEGVVMAMKAGSAVLTAVSADGKVKATAAVTVTSNENPPKPVYYVVTLDPAKGAVSPDHFTVEAYKPYGTLPTPVRSGYNFLGWFNGNVQVKATDSCNCDITLTAKWEPAKPDKVSGLRVSSASTSKVKLTWNKVETATKYSVYRYDTKKKKWNNMAATGVNSFTDTKRTSGTIYQYRVAAYNAVGKGAYSDILKAEVLPGKVSKLSVSSQKTDSVKLSWKKAAGADRYVVYRYDSAKKSWTKAGTTKSASYTDKKRAAGTVYKYRVAATNTTGKGSNSSTCTAATKPVRPVVKVSKSGKNLKASWKKVQVDGYEIYLKKGNGSFEKAGTVSGKKTSFKKTNMKKGSKYTVKVRAYVKQGSKSLYSSYSSEKTIRF